MQTRLRELREDKGLSQADLARKARELGAKIHGPQISNYENGKGQISNHGLLRIATVLGCELVDLLELEPVKRAAPEPQD